MESRASPPGHHIAGPARRPCLPDTESIRLLESTVQEHAMLSRDFIFWEVDVQADFMLPGGKLYVSGAEKLLPNIRKLTDAARRNEVFLVSHGCFHPADDPEFKQFPPHCLKGTPGAEFVPEALTDNFVRVENKADASLPEDLFKYQQIILEKQTLDVFETRNADALVERLGTDAEFVVFGVVTEYCVSCAVKGLLQRKRHVSVVRDAIETLAPQVGDQTLNELQNLGAKLVTTDEILKRLSMAPV
jgi:nicotinamidase/pyrazinamidase